MDMREFFVSAFNTLVRNVDRPIKIIISIVAFLLSFWFLSKSLRKKNDKMPLAWGWFVLCLLCAFIGVVYIIW